METEDKQNNSVEAPILQYRFDGGNLSQEKIIE
jgi:hypothetical protein